MKRLGARLLSTGGPESVRSRSLDEVVKLSAFGSLALADVESLWQTYHAEKPFQCGTSLRTPHALPERAAESPQFVLPVIKKDVGFFVFFSEFNPAQQTLFMTPLDDYRKSPKYCQPWLSFQLFSDVPGVLLGQANFLKNLPKADAQALMDLYVNHYSDDDLYARHARVFNKNADRFDFAEAFPQVKPFLAKQ